MNDKGQRSMPVLFLYPSSPFPMDCRQVASSLNSRSFTPPSNPEIASSDKGGTRKEQGVKISSVPAHSGQSREGRKMMSVPSLILQAGPMFFLYFLITASSNFRVFFNK